MCRSGWSCDHNSKKCSLDPKGGEGIKLLSCDSLCNPPQWKCIREDPENPVCQECEKGESGCDPNKEIVCGNC